MERTLADQSVRELGGRLSVLTRQKQDHVEVDGLPVMRRGEDPSTRSPRT